MSKLRSPARVGLMAVLGTLSWLAACGGGGGAAPPANLPGATVIDFTPATVDSEGRTEFAISGTGFLPVGGDVMLRFTATAGTPFSGGTSDVFEVAGTVDSTSLIRAATTSAGVSSVPTEASLTVFLSDGRDATAPIQMAFRPPTITGAQPTLVGPEIHPPTFSLKGERCGLAGTVVRVRFEAAGSPFLNGTASALEVEGQVSANATIQGTLPAATVSATAGVDTILVTWPSGAVARLDAVPGIPLLEFEPPTKIIASEGVASDLFGVVAIDGDTAVVGAPDYGAWEDSNDSGSVYIFGREAGAWVQQQKLTADDPLGTLYFGQAVAISGDTVLVGSPLGNQDQRGAAYVFVRVDGKWTQQQRLQPGKWPVSPGMSVALSGDTAIVGAPVISGGVVNDGATYVMVREDGVWTEQAELLASGTGAGSSFGMRVALSGNTIVVSAPAGNAGGGERSGWCDVFEFTDGAWHHEQQLRPDGGAAGDRFGSGLALNGDTILVGADSTDVRGEDSGSAYVFTHAGATWTQQQELHPTDGAAGDRFGAATAILGDTALVGAVGDSDLGDKSGSAYVYARVAGQWSQRQKLLAPDGEAGTRFGAALAMDGTTVLIGATGDGELAQDAGALWSYCPR